MKGPADKPYQPLTMHDLWDDVLNPAAVPAGWVSAEGSDGGKPDIAGWQREQLAKAETAAHVTAEELKACFIPQVKAVRAELDRLTAWMAEDEAREGWEETQAWHRTYQRVGHLSETLRLLLERDHVLVCIYCGFGAPAGSEGLWDAISMRGLLTGGGVFDWYRLCAGKECARPMLNARADVKWRGSL
jgi:hypothetical protein